MKDVNKEAYKETMNKAEAIAHLDKVLTDRGKNYGRPFPNHQRMADLLNVYINSKNGKLQAEDMTVIMILFKVARLMESPQHVDSFLDIAGYAICGLDILDDKKEEDRRADYMAELYGQY